MDLVTVREAIDLLARHAEQGRQLERKLDQLLQRLEGLRGHAVPIGLLEPLGLTGDQDMLEPPSAIAKAAAAGVDPAGDGD
jgi:hypothetical protein